MHELTLSTPSGLNAASKLVFKTTDVLQNRRQKLLRKAGLLRAMALDARTRGQVLLTIEDQTSEKKLRGRVVAAADDQVLMESGFVLPVNCILHIEFPS